MSDSGMHATVNRTARTRPFTLALLLVIVLLGMGLRLHGLDADSLWVDEIYTVTTSRLDFLAIPQYVAATGESHPPLLYMLTKSFTALMGGSEFSVRLPAVLLGSLSILLAYKAGEILWGKREGLIAAFLLAINAYHVQYSQEARHYVPMTFLALLSLILLMQALRRNQIAMWLGFALATTLNLYLHYFAFLVLPAELLLAACVMLEESPEDGYHPAHRMRAMTSPIGPPMQPIRKGKPDSGTGTILVARCPLPRRTGLLRYLLASLLLVALSYLPWLPLMSQQLGGSQIEFEALALGAGRYSAPPVEFTYEVLSSYSGVAGAALLLYVILFVLGLASSSRKYTLFAATWILAPFVFASIVKAGHHLRPKYALIVLPIYLLTVARGTACSGRLLARCCRRAEWNRYLPAATLAAILLLLGALAVAPLRAYYVQDKEDWRSVASYLASNMGPGDVIIADGQAYLAGGDATRTARGLTYYLPRYDQDTTVLRAQKGLAASVRQYRGGEGAVWGVLWQVEELHNLDGLEANIQIMQFPLVTVLQVSEPGADLLDNTESTLKALLLIQPLVAGRFDLHLALAEIYSEMDDTTEAMAQARLAGQAAEDYQSELGSGFSPARRFWDWRPHWDLGSTYQDLGMLEEAARAYEEVLTTNPTHLQAYVSLGNVYRQLNEPFKALSAYQQAVEIAPTDAYVRRLLGKTQQGLGRTEEAILSYEEALRIDPTAEWAQMRVNLLSHPVAEGIPHPLLSSVGLELALLGYDLQPRHVEAGGTLDVALWWRAVAKMDKDYTLFIHLIGPEGLLWAQQDSLLLSGDRPTSAWRLGLLVRNEYQLQLPGDAPAGEYSLRVGIYDWHTLERLPVWDENGQRLADEAVILRGVTVED